MINELHDHHEQLMTYSYGLKKNWFDAEDLTQKTYLKAIEKSYQFHGGNLKKWLLTIAKNLHRDERDSARERTTTPSGNTSNLSRDVVYQNHELYSDEVLDKINSLSDRQRVVVLMRAEGYSFADIADYLGCSVGAAILTMRYARIKFLKNTAHA